MAGKALLDKSAHPTNSRKPTAERLLEVGVMVIIRFLSSGKGKRVVYPLSSAIFAAHIETVPGMDGASDGFGFQSCQELRSHQNHQAPGIAGAHPGAWQMGRNRQGTFHHRTLFTSDSMS
jgi:hypothetical protein